MCCRVWYNRLLVRDLADDTFFSVNFIFSCYTNSVIWCVWRRNSLGEWEKWNKINEVKKNIYIKIKLVFYVIAFVSSVLLPSDILLMCGFLAQFNRFSFLFTLFDVFSSVLCLSIQMVDRVGIFRLSIAYAAIYVIFVYISKIILFSTQKNWNQDEKYDNNNNFISNCIRIDKFVHIHLYWFH